MGFSLGLKFGVCNPTGFSVVCFVHGTEIPKKLVRVISEISWFLGWKPMFGVWLQGYVTLLVSVLCVLYKGPRSL